jgi:phosphomevalonate kinase
MTTTKANDRLTFTVNSPQFDDGLWKYEVQDQSVLEINGRNVFIKMALEITIGFMIQRNEIKFKDAGKGEIFVKILADNDFYSQNHYLEHLGLPVTFDSLSQVPKFNHTGSKISNVKKTGLGSSAAMVSAFVGALLVHFGFTNSEELSEIDTKLIEKLAHCFYRFI